MLAEVRAVLLKPWVPRLIGLILLLLLIWEIYDGVHDLWGLNHQTIASKVPADSNIPKNTVGKELRAPIFGEFVPKTISDSNVKRSMLDLNIVGIIFSDKEENSEVILRTADGEEKPVGIGETISDGVVVKRITPEGVMVENQGQLESLSFPKNELLFEKQQQPLFKE